MFPDGNGTAAERDAEDEPNRESDDERVLSAPSRTVPVIARLQRRREIVRVP